VIGGIGHDMDDPAGEGQGEQADQRGGHLYLAGSLPLAGQVQPRQHRQAHLPAAERQPGQDPGGDEAVAVAELAHGRGAAVVLPAGPVHLAPAAAEHRVIDGHAQISAGRHRQQHRQLRDRQAELVKVPAGAGEEVMRPVMRPGMLQAAAQQHAHHGAAAHPPGHPGDQAAERGKARRGEARPQLVQQAQQRSG